MTLVSAALACSLVLASCADQSARPTAHLPAPAIAGGSDKPAPTARKGDVKSITFEEFFALHQSGDLLLLDARPAFFYDLGHIPGAINLPRGTAAESIRKRDGQFRAAVTAGKPIVTYCTGTTCPDAGKLAEQISALGHPVRIFSGGWHAWKDAEMPTE